MCKSGMIIYDQKPYKTRYINNLNLRKKVGITIKSKETSSQLEPVRNSHI